MVYVDGDLEAALRVFKRMTAPIMSSELKRHAFYTSPSERRRKKIKAAIRKRKTKELKHENAYKSNTAGW